MPNGAGWQPFKTAFRSRGDNIAALELSTTELQQDLLKLRSACTETHWFEDRVDVSRPPAHDEACGWMLSMLDDLHDLVRCDPVETFRSVDLLELEV